jgi:exopolysaccharide biosynthesis polyprenyl glycosylphosphotransferase
MNSAQSEIVSLANLCEKMMVQFKVIPSYFQILVSGLHLETVSGIPILGVSRLPLDRTANIVLKRVIDIIGSIVGLVFSIPLIAIFGALVYLESPGPILYRQRRLGRNGQEFFIFKIRSMKLNAEAKGQIGWTTKNDPRRLRIGGFMRKWNIDEIPQFWNVLMGEMSLVGPRPERPELIRNFKDEIPHYNARHNVKPGITGWAQVKGFRGDTDLGERIKCDLFYLENWNVLLDFQIMLMTFSRRENAC